MSNYKIEYSYLLLFLIKITIFVEMSIKIYYNIDFLKKFCNDNDIKYEDT